MIVGAVLCPHPPLLFRELTGRTDPAPELRDACHDVLTKALQAAPELVVVVGAHDEPGMWEGDVAVQPYGTGQKGSLPLCVGVGRRLLDECGWTGPTELATLGWDAKDDAVDALADVLSRSEARTLVLAMGEGSTRRGDKAPGYLDERSFPFDAAVAEALRTGDADALRSLDVGLAEDLMVLGRTAFRVLGALGEPDQAELVYDDDPFGVAYFVARWSYERGTMSNA